MTTISGVSTRRFELHRDHDVSGVSGTGVVADGVRWPDGSVSIRWRGERPSVVFWHSLADAEQVHGHGGATRFVWLDDMQDLAEFVVQASLDGEMTVEHFRIDASGQCHWNARIGNGASMPELAEQARRHLAERHQVERQEARSR